MATIVKDLGAVTAYAYAVEKGYTGTEDEFAELMASYADVAEQAAESAAQAGASATEAEQAKAEAVLSASAAASSASTASTKASEAASSASSAAGSANTATTKANEASASATAAAQSATQAQETVDGALSDINTAKEAALAAVESAEDDAVQTVQTEGATQTANAKAQADAAAASATAAAGSASTANTKAGEAASSATVASNAQTAAETAQGKAEDAQTAAEDAAEQAEIYAAGYLKAFPVDTASGAVANFPDGADELPVKDLTVAIEPVQDLHGQANPWPAGGGKNLIRNFESFTISGVTVETTEDGEVWIHGTPTISSGFIAFPTGAYFPSDVIGKAVTVSVNEKTVGIGFAFGSSNGSINLTMTETNSSHTGEYTSQSSSAGQLTVNIRYDVGTIDKKYKVQLEIGSTATSWTPYSNICPISGWTGANVTRTGKNLLDVSNTSHNAYNIGNIPNTLKEGAQYTFSVNGTTDKRYRLYLAKSDNPVNALVPLTAAYILSGDSQTFTAPSMDGYDLLCLAGSPNGAGNEAMENILPMLELGSTATAYEPYQGDTYSITFPSEAGTVYGGTLDVTTGKLTVTHKVFIFTGTEDFTYGGLDNVTAVYIIPNGADALLWKQHPEQDTVNFKCSHYVWSDYVYNPSFTEIKISEGSSGHGERITFMNSLRNQTMNEFKAYLASQYSTDTPVTACAPLATPIVYDLTPIEVTTLLATNNVWADAGDSTVEYRADPTLYINKKIAALAAAMN